MRKLEVEHPLMNTPESAVFKDVYDSEIGDGEEYFENEFGEAIHLDNLVDYILEEQILIKRTR